DGKANHSENKKDRDPEAEAEEKVEEEKLITAPEEEVPVAIESGFPAAGGDWDAPAPGFAGATPAVAAAGWDGAGAGAGADWAASGGQEWAADAPKDSQW
ncbi:hypothetical protein M440DRAFT_1422934, partial [Trichoderma longibrachiatum ATCC 18648]